MISDKRVAWKRSSDAGRATLHPVLSRAPGEEASSGQGQEGGRSASGSTLQEKRPWQRKQQVPMS